MRYMKTFWKLFIFIVYYLMLSITKNHWNLHFNQNIFKVKLIDFVKEIYFYFKKAETPYLFILIYFKANQAYEKRAFNEKIYFFVSSWNSKRYILDNKKIEKKLYIFIYSKKKDLVIITSKTFHLHIWDIKMFK